MSRHPKELAKWFMNFLRESAKKFSTELGASTIRNRRPHRKKILASVVIPEVKYLGD